MVIEVNSEGVAEVKESKETAEFIDRYLDLNVKAFDPRASDEERSSVATGLIDLHRMLEDGRGLSPEFASDMRAQLKRIESGFVYIKKLELAVRTLERESSRGVMVPHIYRNTVQLFQEASASGVNESVLEYFKPYIDDYLNRVRAAQAS